MSGARRRSLGPREEGTGETVTIVAHDVGGIGGMERQLEALIEGLLAREANVVVVSRTLELAPHPGLRWHRVPGPSRPFALAYPWFALLGTAIVARERRGVLHTTGAIVLNHADVCTVHYLHNSRSRPIQRMQKSTLLYRLNARTARIMSRLAERLVYSTPARSGALVAVSATLAEGLLDAFPGRARSIYLIENGVDAERFQPDQTARREIRALLGIGAAVPLGIFVGSEWRSKGLQFAVEALAAAPSWHLAVIGRGDAEEVSQVAAQLDVGSRLHLVGESASPEGFYAAADAFVLPSAYETFSLAAFEAAASGVPVLSTDVGAIGAIVAAGGGAFVERSAESIANALRELESNREAAAEMSERARAAARRFDWRAAVEKYVDLYARRRDVSAAVTARTAF